MSSEKLARAAEAIIWAGCVLARPGTGIYTECGEPTFRSLAGLWKPFDILARLQDRLPGVVFPVLEACL